MRTSAIARLSGTLAAAMLVLGLDQPAAGDEVTVKAFAVWQGRGQVTQTGANEATFVGTLAGTVYIETDKGPIASGHIECPALIDIKLDDSSQTARGRCTMTAEDGAQLFAAIDCSGFHLIGCHGETKLTGGTGRFADIKGGGEVTLRSDQRAFAVESGSSMREAATGIIYWPALRYTMP